MNRFLFFGLQAALAGVVVSQTLACSGGEATPASASVAAGDVPQSPGTRVEVVRLENTDAQLDLRLPGEITGSRDATLASAAGGFVEGVYVKRGEYIQKGTVIARINSSVFAAQLEQAEAQLSLVTSELERVEALGDLATASQLQAARTQMEVARANARLAEVSASRSAIRAPFDGTVTQIDLEVGEVLGPTAPQVTRLHGRLKITSVAFTASKAGVGFGARAEVCRCIRPYPNRPRDAVLLTNMAVDIRTIEFGVRAVVEAALFGVILIVTPSALQEQLPLVCITIVAHVPILPSAARPRWLAW